jgi:B12-binding domain/radical SAM domain protein of rhizo-twelve system
MKVALVNPPWAFDGSIYFGCREPHLPLELGYARALLEAGGHEVLLLDGHLCGRSSSALADEVAAFGPALTVVTTAPSYLFWRCPPPELKVPAAFIRQLDGRGGRVAAVGPHGSTTPRPTLRKLGADLVVTGECEGVIAAVAEGDFRRAPGVAWLDDGDLNVNGGPQASHFVDHAPLVWPSSWVQRHLHHHHRFEAPAVGPGAEVEASRGCIYSCSFCAKLDFRDKYRRRDLCLLLEEIDGLIDQGVTYLYFIDEIFLPNEPLLRALADRDVLFGIQTRIDLWKPGMLELLGRAGCVSIEAGVESLTVAGRAALDKRCRLDTPELTSRLIEARRHVPFVQANLIGGEDDEPAEIAVWREHLRRHEVWANDPVPLFPYPASPDYRKRWGPPDDDAWERAHEHYLHTFERFSDIQDERPVGLAELEAACAH